MTKTFAYKFNVIKKKEGTSGKSEQDWYAEQVTLTKKVTDRMEERNIHKAVYAANYFNEVLRTQYGYKKSVVTAAKIQEI